MSYRGDLPARCASGIKVVEVINKQRIGFNAHSGRWTLLRCPKIWDKIGRDLRGIQILLFSVRNITMKWPRNILLSLRSVFCSAIIREVSSWSRWEQRQRPQLDNVQSTRDLVPSSPNWEIFIKSPRSRGRIWMYSLCSFFWPSLFLLLVCLLALSYSILFYCLFVLLCVCVCVLGGGFSWLFFI